MSKKTVIIDDANATISYSGNWTPLGPLTDTSHEYNDTIHRGDTNGQSLSYTFSGTGISVYGSLDQPARKGLPGVEFKIDDMDPRQINSTPPLTYELDKLRTRIPLWKSPNLSDQSHNITITVTNATENGPYFYFDFFAIETNRDSVAGRVLFDDRDDAMQYVPEWKNNGIPSEYMGTTSECPGKGSTATFTFNGKYLETCIRVFANM